jgi:hypothetical protein
MEAVNLVQKPVLLMYLVYRHPQERSENPNSYYTAFWLVGMYHVQWAWDRARTRMLDPG